MRKTFQTTCFIEEKYPKTHKNVRKRIKNLRVHKIIQKTSECAEQWQKVTKKRVLVRNTSGTAFWCSYSCFFPHLYAHLTYSQHICIFFDANAHGFVRFRTFFSLKHVLSANWNVFSLLHSFSEHQQNKNVRNRKNYLFYLDSGENVQKTQNKVNTSK